MKNPKFKRERSYVSPHPVAYGGFKPQPTALEREQTTESQIDNSENTIIWGAQDQLPLVIILATNASPTTGSCLGTIDEYVKGSGFTDPGLMEMVVDPYGTTLWDLHCQKVEYETLLAGSAINFKFNNNGKINAAYSMAVEGCRFVNPEKASKDIEYLKFNPYFGTGLYQQKYSQKFPLFDLEVLRKQASSWESKEKVKFPGQVYWCGPVRPPFKFYPVPKYWRGEGWIYVDGNIQTFHKSNLDNGFFQSVLMNVVGDPDAWSNDPSQMVEEVGTDGTKRKKPTKTNAQMFDEMMSATFSGARKAGSVLALWSKTEEQAIKIQAFPVNSQFDVMSGTFTDAIRGITIATEVPAILANLPQQASSLGSDGNSMLRAVEIMQSKTEPRRIKEEQFLNNILLKNWETSTAARVKIKQHNPISRPVTIEDKFWEFMNENERVAFLKKNTDIEIIRPIAAEQPATPTPTEPTTASGNEALKALNVQQIKRLQKIVSQVESGAMTYDQGKQFLMGYGLAEDQIAAWLSQPDPVTV